MESSISGAITNPNTTLITNTDLYIQIYKYVHTDEDDGTDEDRLWEEDKDDETNKGKVPKKWDRLTFLFWGEQCPQDTQLC